MCVCFFSSCGTRRRAQLGCSRPVINQWAIQTQSTMLCHGATQNSSPITDTITSDCSSCLCRSVSRRLLLLTGCMCEHHFFLMRDLVYLDIYTQIYTACVALVYFSCHIFSQVISILLPPDVPLFPHLFGSSVAFRGW